MEIDERSYLERTNNGTVFTGTDVQIFQALSLASSISLFQKTGMLPTRGVTATKMLKLASGITGKTFKRRQYDQAIEALKEYANTLKHLPANIPDIL